MRKLSMGQERKGGGTKEPPMAPLIDMIFILLIFFLVTTSFVKESGVVVKQPVPSKSVSKEQTNLIVQVAQDGAIYIENRHIDIQLVRAYMERRQIEVPKGTVVIAADRESLIGIVIQVLDMCRLAGINDVSVAPLASQKQA